MIRRHDPLGPDVRLNGMRLGPGDRRALHGLLRNLKRRSFRVTRNKDGSTTIEQPRGRRPFDVRDL